MTGPKAKDGAAILRGFFITKPVSHDGRTDRSSSGLEESKEEVYDENDAISEHCADAVKVEPNGDIDQKETRTRTP